MSGLLHAASTGKQMCKSESKPFRHKDSYIKLGGSCILRVHMQYPFGSLFKFVVTQASTRIRQNTIATLLGHESSSIFATPASSRTTIPYDPLGSMTHGQDIVDWKSV